MLRITENQKLKFHERDYFLSKDLRKALVCALSFHVVFFIIFHVTTLPDLNNLPLLQPVNIEIDLGDTSPTIFLPLSLTQSFIDEVGPPIFLDLQPHIFTCTPDTFLEFNYNLADFSEIEKIDYHSLLLEDDDI